MRLLLDIIIRLLQLGIQFLILICPILLLLEDLPMILILISHLLCLTLQLQKLSILFLDISFRLGDILLELGVEVNEHVLPIEQVFLPITEHLMVSFDLFRKRLSHFRKSPLRSSVRCKKLIIENAFHFHLLSILLVVEILVLLRRIIEIVVICRCLTLDHSLKLVTLLHQLLVQLFELVPLSHRVFQLLGHRVNIIFTLLHNSIDLETGYYLHTFICLRQAGILLLKSLMHHELVKHLGL